MTTLVGGVSRQAYATTLPPDRFYCLLDELPLHLVPQRALRSLQHQKSRNQLLYLNPECVLCTARQVPDELASQEALLSRFALQGTIAWVRSRATGKLLPFWLGPQLERVLQDLRANEPLPSSVPDGARIRLFAADILLSPDRAEPCDRQRKESIGSASQLFRAKGYAPLPNLIHPFHIAALRRYYRYLIRTGAIPLGDGQSPRRYVAYNDPVARFFHQDIAAIFSAVAGESLKPSYVYLASYLSGAELKSILTGRSASSALRSASIFLRSRPSRRPGPFGWILPTAQSRFTSHWEMVSLIAELDCRTTVAHLAKDEPRLRFSSTMWEVISQGRWTDSRKACQPHRKPEIRYNTERVSL